MSASLVCVPLVDSLVRGRPFVYLPDDLRSALRQRLSRALRICVTSSFVQVPCKSCPERLCFLAGDQAYYIDGVAAITAEVRAGGSSVKLAFTVRSIGVLGNGGNEILTGGCPFEDCDDQKVSGRLACEIGGSIAVSTNLLPAWNQAATFNVVAWLLTINSGAVPLGNLLSLLDLRDPQAVAGQPFFEVALKGEGPNGGILYDLGQFTLTPP